jgi:hypothetical protein
MVEFWVSMLPLPETMPPAVVGNARRLDRVDTVCSLGRAWRNCLATYGSAIDAGTCAVYLWEDAERPAACLINRHGRLGWFLDEVKGPRNSEVEPQQFALIGTAFVDVGVPSSQVATKIGDRGVSEMRTASTQVEWKSQNLCRWTLNPWHNLAPSISTASSHIHAWQLVMRIARIN